MYVYMYIYIYIYMYIYIYIYVYIYIYIYMYVYICHVQNVKIDIIHILKTRHFFLYELYFGFFHTFEDLKETEI